MKHRESRNSHSTSESIPHAVGCGSSEKRDVRMACILDLFRLSIQKGSIMNRVALLTVVSLITAGIAPAASAETVEQAEKTPVWSEEQFDRSLKEITPEEKKQLELISNVGEHIDYDDEGNLKSDLNDDQLRSDYGFEDKDVSFFHSVLAEDESIVQHKENEPKIVTTYDHKLGHISNSDLTVGTAATLTAAAMEGPATLEAAFFAWGAVAGGPIGAAISGAAGLLGATYFVDLATKITGAVAQGKGITWYSKWGFPPITAEIEDD